MSNNRVRYENALNAGHSFSWDQRWEDAIKQFEIAIQESPNEPTAYAGLAMAYSELSRPAKALQNYKLASKYSQGDLIYLKHIADLQEMLGQKQEASQTFMAVGEALLRQRALDDALDSWHKAVRLQPDLMGGHQRLAAVYKKQGKIPSAIRQYLEIARILQKNGEKSKALHTCNMALQLDPRNQDAQTAIELIKRGEAIFTDASEATSNDLFDGSASEIANQQQLYTPLDDAREKASTTLAAQMFGDDDEDFNPAKMQQVALISQALDLQTRKQTDGAIDLYQKIVAMGNVSAAARFNLGLLYQDSMMFDEAIKEFELAAQDTQFVLGAHFAVGQSHRVKGRIKQSLTSFLNALQAVDITTVADNKTTHLIGKYSQLRSNINLESDANCTRLANAYIEFLSQEEWYERAKEARVRIDSMASSDELMTLADMLAIGSEHVMESLYLSKKYSEAGFYGSALEELYRAIYYSPEYLPAHELMGELLLKQSKTRTASQKFSAVGDTYRIRGDINNAIRNYERIVDISPLDVEGRFRLATILQSYGHINKTLDQYLGIGDAYYQLAQVNKARDVYQKALDISSQGDPDQKWRNRFLTAIADIDMQRLDWKKALTTYVELRRIEPDDPKIATTLVDLLYKVGQPDHALRELDRFLVQLIKSRQSDQVEEVLVKLIRNRPTDGAISGRLVRLYMQKKDRESAIKILDGLGDAQLDAGNKRDALETIEQMLKLKPPNIVGYQQLAERLRKELGK